MIDAPLSESLIVGAGVGAALIGLRPIVEIMYIDFATLASDQIINQAAKFHFMTGGHVRVPLVVRTQQGTGRSAAAQHSQSLETWYMHIPGLKVVLPSTPYDAKGLLKSAIRDENPVLFIEHKALYTMKGEVPEGEYAIPIGTAEVKRDGNGCHGPHLFPDGPLRPGGRWPWRKRRGSPSRSSTCAPCGPWTMPPCRRPWRRPAAW